MVVLGRLAIFLHFAKDSQLLKAYDVLLIDRPGYGYSDFGAGEMSISKQASIFNEIISQFNYKDVFLVGHSLGGPIICLMCMERPKMYKGIQIVAGSVAPELEPHAWWRKPLNNKLIRWITPKSFRVSNQEIMHLPSELEKMTSHWSEITCDVQILHGDRDKLVPRGNADYAKKMLKNANSVVVFRYPELGHFIPFEYPEYRIEGLLSFGR